MSVKEFIKNEFVRADPHNANLLEIAMLMNDDQAVDDLLHILEIAEHFQNHYCTIRGVVLTARNRAMGASMSILTLRELKARLPETKRIFLRFSKGVDMPNIRRLTQWIRVNRPGNNWHVDWSSITAGEDVIDFRQSETLLNLGRETKSGIYQTFMAGTKHGASSNLYRKSIATFAQEKLGLVWDINVKRVPVSVAIAYESVQYAIARRKDVKRRGASAAEGKAMTDKTAQALCKYFDGLITANNMQTALWRACMIRRLVAGRGYLTSKSALSQIAAQVLEFEVLRWAEKVDDKQGEYALKGTPDNVVLDEKIIKRKRETLRQIKREAFRDRTADQINALEEFAYNPKTGDITNHESGKTIGTSILTFKCCNDTGFVSRSRFMLFWLLRKNNIPLEHAFQFVMTAKNKGLYGTQAYWLIDNWYLQAKRQAPIEVVTLVAGSGLEVRDRNI